MTARVALIGANGYGRSHRRRLASMQQAGALELVAVCDLAPVQDEPEAPLPATAHAFLDYRDVFASVEVDVAIICTPPHTHLPIATAAAQAGADLLLEKPPLLSLAEHRALTAVLAETGRACQVGFQALGSAALAELAGTLAAGTLAPIRSVSAVGAWQRPDAYYRRSPWAGRRTVAGRPSLDGALTNPFAHALMQCLAVAEAAAGAPVWPVELELERYRARPIEVDDTTVVRVRLADGPPVLVAVTLCADDDDREPEVLIHTGAGRAVHGYTTDRLRLPGSGAASGFGRTDLLSDLLAGGQLVAPLSRTVSFTALAEAVAAAPEPVTIDAAFQRRYGTGPDRVVTVPGVHEVLRQAAQHLALPSESGVPWAAPPWRVSIPVPPTGIGPGVQQTGG